MEFKDYKIDAVKRVSTDVSSMLPSSGYKRKRLHRPNLAALLFENVMPAIFIVYIFKF